MTAKRYGPNSLDLLRLQFATDAANAKIEDMNELANNQIKWIKNHFDVDSKTAWKKLKEQYEEDFGVHTPS